MSQTTTDDAARRARTPLAHPDHAAAAGGTTLARDVTTSAAYGATATDTRDHRIEPWVKFMLGAVVPAFAAMYVPHAIKLALFAMTGAMFVAALVMLVRQEQRRGARE